MKLRLVTIGLLIAIVGCGSKSANSPLLSSLPRSYNGTASVGDFLIITLDPAALTLTYKNLSNGDGATIPYTVNPDGTYKLDDPTGNLLAAYEVPDFALLVQAAKTGPKHNALALVTAVNSSKISLSTWASHKFNYMQFRTASGGLEVGSVNVDNQGNISVSSYWPYGALGPDPPFHQGTFPASGIQSDPSGTFLISSDNGSQDYIFGTPSGVFAVDTPNGAILGLKKDVSKDFDPAWAGTYEAIYYQKKDANTGMNNVETGTASLGNATMIVGTKGNITVNDPQGKTLLQATLTPIADSSYLYGPGKLQDPCHGLFTFRVLTADSQQEVFVTFMERSILFSSFHATLPWDSGNSYDYLYGVGIK